MRFGLIMETKKENVAYIESMVTDQGNGWSYCSNCNFDLTDYTAKQTQKRIDSQLKFPRVLNDTQYQSWKKYIEDAGF